LFDRTGKLVGQDKRNIMTDQSDHGPVFLASPKVGATVAGPVEISLGFGRDLKTTYVNFFIDKNFKKMTNYPPYSYIWDTQRETNGWHTIEGWAMN
ncbi:Ig-like domain-containing protein, partial [Enterococcus casseliflavus]|uniref:Ig-like domain-containing protein n=1 Tax=Enterococcus casseliflavus TaxID=37734 RepID=UPI003D0B2089